MRFGISATSSIFPKNFLTRFRPVNVCAIMSSRSIEPSGPRPTAAPPQVRTITPGRMRRMLLRHPRALFRGIEAKTTLQRAAIHRDRRDRRHSPCYSALLRAIRLLKPHRCFAVLRPGMTGRRTLHFVGSPALAPLARGCPPKPHLAMAGFGPAIYDLDSHLRLRLPSTTWTLGIPGGLAPLGRGIS